MSSRWCGVTSAVTAQPLLLAQRISSTEPAVETWQTCSREPTCPASRQSRAMIASSATAGQPAHAEDAGHRALVHLGVLGEPRLLGVLGDHPVERLDVLERSAHQHRVRDAVAVVGEDPHLGHRVGHGAELGEPFARQPGGHRADRDGRRSTRAVWPRFQTCSTTPAVSATGSVLAIAWTAVKPPQGRGLRPRERPSRRPRGRAHAGGCAGRRGPAGPPARPRRLTVVPEPASAGSPIRPSCSSRSAGSPPRMRCPAIR